MFILNLIASESQRNKLTFSRQCDNFQMVIRKFNPEQIVNYHQYLSIIFLMSFRRKSVQLTKREKKHLRSLSELLNQQHVPPPQAITNNIMFQTSTQFNSSPNQAQFNHKKHSLDISRENFAYKQSVKSHIMQKLRKTWYPPRKPQQKAPIKTPEISLHRRYQSLQITNRNTAFTVRFRNTDRRSSKLGVNRMESQGQKTEESNFTPQCKKPIHNFLRKGSNINKQVVTNILKLKLSKKSHEFNSLNDNQQIVNMIRLYKGYGQDPEMAPKIYKLTNQKKVSQKPSHDNGTPLRNRNILEKSIIGWREKSDEEQENYGPNIGALNSFGH